MGTATIICAWSLAPLLSDRGRLDAHLQVERGREQIAAGVAGCVCWRQCARRRVRVRIDVQARAAKSSERWRTWSPCIHTSVTWLGTSASS
jgi:hypothetical protein